MSQHNFRKRVNETCRYWREGKCQKGDYQCNFVHGIICPNDGRCWKENCNRIHFNQKNVLPRDHYGKPHPQNYQRDGGHRSRYRRSHSRSQSPPRHRKMFQRGRSPPHHRSRSRSPPYSTRVYSPYQRRSRSPSPFRAASRSPNPPRRRSRSRHRSRSWHRSKSPSVSRPIIRGRSPGRIKSRSSSPVQSKSKSRISGKARHKSRSPSRSVSRSSSPKTKRRSNSSSRSSSSSSSTSRTRSRSSSISKGGSKNRAEYVHQSSSVSSVKDKSHQPDSSKSVNPVPVVTETERGPPNMYSSNAGHKMQLDLENIYADLEYERNPVSRILDKDTREKEALSKLQAHIARDFMNPDTQKLMEQVLSATRDRAVKPNPFDESKSKKEFFLDEVGDDIELDLEEVGEEVDDIFTKSINRSMDDSNEGSFDKGLSTSRKLEVQAGSNPSPPKSNPVSKSEKSTDDFIDDFHTDWDLKAALETASKSLKKPSQMPPPNQLPDGSKMGSTSLWTPALARHQTQTSVNRVGYQRKDSDWEVETPYVGRKDKSEIQRSAAPPRTSMSDAPSVDVSSSIPFALPLSEPQNIHRSSHTGTEILQERKDGRMIQQTDVLFPSAQSIPSCIPSLVQSIPSSIPSIISHAMNQPSKPSALLADQGALGTSILSGSTANLIRDEINEKEFYHSPKEGATAPKKVSQEQTPQKPSESPKRSKRKRRKEKKLKRKKDSSEDEVVSSESDDSKEDKKSAQETEKGNDEIEMLLFKRESLMKRVKLLVEQKNMMSNQREDIISNHKGSKASLSSILEENSFLTQEIRKQIENISKIIKTVNQDIEGKKGSFKQKTSISKERSESPYVSGESQKKSLYSAEKETISKKLTERSEVYRASPYQEKRSKSPYQKNSRSPSPLSHFKRGPIEAEQKLKERDSINSRSPKAIRHKRSRSPSSNVLWEAPKPVPPPEMKQNASPPRKRPIKSTIEVNKKPAGPASQHQTAASSVQYAPYEGQRTYIRYTDQGMHWCKLCSIFCETAPEYVSHLMTESHLARLKNDRRTWLSKATREEKDPKPPNAQVLTVPIQGLEFLHSLPCYYCSLCDTFMRDRGEALRHPESKMHVSKYKVHRAQNPLFESTFLKAKTSAYAKYKIDEERKKMESEFNLNEKATSLENKLLKQIKEKFDKENKEDRTSDSRDDPAKACSSIRVASRGPRYSTDKKSSTTQSPPSSISRPSREKETLPKSSDSFKKKTERVRDSKAEVQKSELVDSEHDDSMDNSEGSDKPIDKPNVEDKLETKQKEEESTDGSRDKDTDRKAPSTKLPLIGKMPFLKRKAGISKSKQQQSIPAEEVSIKKIRVKEDDLSGKLKIPLPSCTVNEHDANPIVDRTQLTVLKEVGEWKLPVTSVKYDKNLFPVFDPTVPPPPFIKANTLNKRDIIDTSGSALSKKDNFDTSGSTLSERDNFDTSDSALSKRDSFDTGGSALSNRDKIDTSGSALSNSDKIDTIGSALSDSDKIDTSGSALSNSDKIDTIGSALSNSDKIDTSGSALSNSDKIDTSGSALSNSDKIDTSGSALSNRNKIDTGGTALNERDKIDISGSALNERNKIDTGGSSLSKRDNVDTAGSALYDPLEAGDEDSSEGIAAATIEALDLLNIPLPGFKTPTHIPELSAVPLTPETEDVYQPEDMEIENIPMDEGGIGGGIEEVYTPSGIIVHPNLPLLPAIGIPPTPLTLNEPPPPGTEGTDLTLNCKLGVNVHPGNMLPVFGPQEFVSMQKEDASIPVPPGTEDEYNTQDIPCPSHLSDQSRDKVDRIGRQRLHSESNSPSSNGKSAPFSFSGKILENTPVKPKAVPKTQQQDKQFPHLEERELTPPPPGTENLSDEKDLSIMGTTNKDLSIMGIINRDLSIIGTTNKGAIKDLEMVPAESALIPSIPKIDTSKENVVLSSKNSSSTCSSSMSLLSNKSKADDLEDKASETVQDKCIKVSASECSTGDAKNNESDSKYDYKERFPTPPEQPDTGITALSSNSGCLSQTDRAASHSEEGSSGSEFSTSISLQDADKVAHPKVVVISNLPDKNYSSNQCVSAYTNEKQDSDCIDEGRPCTTLPEKHDTENLNSSSLSQTDKVACRSEDGNSGSEFPTSISLRDVDKVVHPKVVVLINVDDEKDSSNKCVPMNTNYEKQDFDSIDDDRSCTTLPEEHNTESLASLLIDTTPFSNSVCDTQYSDQESVPLEHLSYEQMCLKEAIKSNIECCGAMNETSLIHSNDDKCHRSPQCDTSNIDKSPINTPSKNTLCESQDSDKGSISKECLPDDQKSNSHTCLKEIPESSNEFSALVNEKSLTLSIDINEERKSPIIKCGSPLQFVNFPKSFENMDIADLYSPSTSDSTCIQNMDASETDSNKMKNYPFSISAENVIDAGKELSGTPQEKPEFKDNSTESDVEKDEKETKAIEEASCSQTIEIHENELDSNKNSNEDNDSLSNEEHDFHGSNDIEDEVITIEYPTGKEAQTEENRDQETCKESEDISLDSAVLIDEIDSKTCEEEPISCCGNVKGGKRKSLRKGTRKRTTKVKMIDDDDTDDDDDCSSTRTSASRSSAGRLSPSFAESPRPMRSSRRAAVAAIKAMAKDQDDTPPDSPPSDYDVGY